MSDVVSVVVDVGELGRSVADRLVFEFAVSPAFVGVG